MKTLGKIILLSAGISLLTACSDESGQSNLLEPTRSLTVKSLLTRTTIGYEGSDFSHLEWREGDRVAYVTDLPGEVFRTAEVSDNRFTAELPARAAADNVLIVVWPAASNQGRPLAEATLTLAAETVQTAGAEFDGSLLPMYARIPIPASGAEVDAEYLQPASGIESSEAVTPFTWKIERNADTGMYSLYSNRDNVYVGSPGAMMVNDYGKLFFKEEIPQTDEGAVTYYWDISVDAEKAMVKSLRLENTYFQFNANRNVEAFCTCTPDTNGWQHIKIFKLRE